MPQLACAPAPPVMACEPARRVASQAPAAAETQQPPLWVVAILIGTLAVQDLGLPERALGRLGGFATYLVLPFLLPPVWPALRELMRSQSVLRLWRGWIVLVSILSIAALPFVPAVTRGQSAAVSAGKLVVTMLCALAVLGLAVLIGRDARARTVARRTLIGALIVTSGLVLMYRLGYKLGPASDVASFWHAGADTQVRARALTAEASTAGAFLVAGIALLILLSTRLLQWLPTAGLCAVALLELQSRGALPALAIALAMTAGFHCLLRFGWRRTAIVASVAVGLFLSVYADSLYSLAKAGNAHAQTLADGSNASRAAYFAAGREILVSDPLGGTFSGSLAGSQQWMTNAAQSLTTSYTSNDLYEVTSLLRSESPSDFSPKTLPGFMIFQSGWLGLALIAATTALATAAAARARKLAVTLGVFTFIALSFTYLNPLYAPELLVLLGVALGSADREPS